jgi:hypothetical protein
MKGKQTKITDRMRYYRGAADFWREAARLQQNRCLQNHNDSTRARADLSFYVVAVQRLREVARMVNQRLKIEAAEQALAQFDNEWPEIKRVRNHEEHILGPSLDAPVGITYFRHCIADLQSDGNVVYIVDVERTSKAVERLYSALCELLVTEEN